LEGHGLALLDVDVLLAFLGLLRVTSSHFFMVSMWQLYFSKGKSPTATTTPQRSTIGMIPQLQLDTFLGL